MGLILVLFILWGASALFRGGINVARMNRIERLEKEAMERKAEAKRQDAEMKRLAKESEKHEAQLEKHEKEIKKLKVTVKQSKDDFKAMRQRLETLVELHDLASEELAAAVKAGDNKRKEKALRKILSLDNQIATAEKKRVKAAYDWKTAKEKLSA